MRPTCGYLFVCVVVLAVASPVWADGAGIHEATMDTQICSTVFPSDFLTDAWPWVASWLWGFRQGYVFSSETLKNSASEAITVHHTVLAEGYSAGEPLDIQVELRLEGDLQITALGIYETLPADWTFSHALASSQNLPLVAPLPGEEGAIGFAYIWVPEFPIRFDYRVNVPEDATGSQYLSGQAEYRCEGGQLYSAAAVTEITPLRPPCCGCMNPPSADLRAPSAFPACGGRGYAGNSLVLAVLALVLAAGGRPPQAGR